MLKRWLQKMWKRVVNAISCFLREPLRAVAAAGLLFGAIFLAMVVVLVVSMFIPTMPLATTIVVPFTWLAGAILALIAVIVMAQLGFDKFGVTLPNGVSITAEDARDRLEKLTDSEDQKADQTGSDEQGDADQENSQEAVS